MPQHPLTRLARLHELAYHGEDDPPPITITFPAIEYLADFDEWLEFIAPLEVEPVVSEWAQATKLTYQLGQNIEVLVYLGTGVTDALHEQHSNADLVGSYMKGHPNP